MVANHRKYINVKSNHREKQSTNNDINQTKVMIQ